MSAAPWHRRVLAQVSLDVRTALRNGEQLLLTLVLPALALVVLGRTQLVDLGTDDRLALVVPGVLALAVVSNAFTSRAIALAFDRRSGVLRLLATTPLGPGGLLAGSVGAVLVLLTVQVTVLGILGIAMGWRPAAAGLPWAVLAITLGATSLGALAMLLAGALRAEAVLAAANLLWVLLLVGGGLVVPPDLLPGPLGTLAPWQPAGALADALRLALTGTVPVRPLVVLSAWTLILVPAARRWFRWH